MLAKLRKEQDNEEGFTLIELLVVVIIIGILAAIAIPAFLNQRERAYQAAIVSDTRNAALEVEADYTATNGTAYPADQTEFEALFDGDLVTAPDTASLAYTTDVTTWFCVSGTDTRLDNGPFVYDSAQNGMLEPGETCSNGGGATSP